MEDQAGTRSYVHAPRSYALSGKVMLSAIVVLFFVVLFILGLHVYARCCIIRHRRNQLRREASRRMRRRQSRLVFVGENSAVVEFVPPRGLDASALLSLPIFVFSSKSDEKAEEETMECAVCLSEFREGEVGRKLPKCNHSFHIDCIDMWFLSHSTCPLCRAGVHPQPPSEESHRLVSAEFASGPDVSSSSQPCDSCRAEQENIFSGSSSPTSSLSSSSTSSSSSASVVLHTSCQQDSHPHRKKGGIRIEVPNRGEALEGEASSALTPGSRILSLKRILSRDRKFSPRAYPGGSPREVDLERGGDADQIELPSRRQP